MVRGQEMSLLTYLELQKLVVTGVISANMSQINGASIDITMGDEIMVEAPGKGMGTVDLAAKETPSMRIIRLNESGYALMPGQFCLAHSAEIFNLPDNIAAEYKLKSSLARAGLNHALAGWADPLWSNSQLTLELTNTLQDHRLRIRPGMKIGQIVFWRGESVPHEHSYAVKGQYNNQAGVVASKGVR